MTDDAQATRDTGDGEHVNDADADDDSPIYLPPGGAEAVPGFCERLLAHLSAGVDEPEFTFEGVDVEQAQGIWLAPLGGYDPEQDPDRPTSGYADLAETSVEAVRRELRGAWGDPLVRTPRLVGVDREPEGILDYVMVAVRFAEGEMWDRGPWCCVLLTGWDGEPRTSVLRQILIVLPRELAFGGMAAMADDEVTIHDRLMHGEHPVELHRRAWLRSALTGQGEVRIDGPAIAGVRCSLRGAGGAIAVWTFADDGRILVLFHDPASSFAAEAPDRLIADQLTDHRLSGPAGELAEDVSPEDRDALRADALLILVARMLDGVPDDLRELIAAPARTGRGEPARHELEFRALGELILPLISGVAWFDGEHWRVPVGLLEIGSHNDFGLDDVGFDTAIRAPLRLGGDYPVDAFARPGDDAMRSGLQRLWAACPYPEQPRPPAEQRLGTGLPAEDDVEAIVEQIERATEVWWDAEPDGGDGPDGAFRIAGRALRGDDGRVLHTVLALAQPWTVDVLEAWVSRLDAAMDARWGQPFRIEARDPATGVERRTPVTRVMRGVGLLTAPLWWVNGHAVLMVAGAPDPSYDEPPQAILVIARADAVVDPMRGTRTWELRQRARVISTLAAITSGSPQPEEIAWAGPPLAGSDLIPAAVRGRFRAGDHHWVWHFAHDGRGMLLSFPIDGSPAAVPPPSFDDQVELFSGLPADLLSLVIDRDADADYPLVTRDGDGADGARRTDDSGLSGARSLPAAQSVLWRDLYDWRVSDGMLRRARPAHPSTADPLEAMRSERLGVPQLQRTLAAAPELSVEVLVDDRYWPYVFDRAPSGDEAAAAYAQLGTVHGQALTGSLNGFLDAAFGMPDRRFVLDAVLANPDPRHRREIALLLLESDVDLEIQLSHLTPINVLLQNPTLEADDLPVLRRLLEAGANPGLGLGGAAIGRHPLVQLADRDLDEATILSLADQLARRAGPGDLVAPVLADGRSVLDYIAAGQFPHRRPRAGLLALITAVAHQGDA